MPFIEMNVTGIDNVKNAAMRRQSNLPRAVYRATETATRQLLRYVKQITHVRSGALKSSHDMEVVETVTGALAKIYTDASVYNRQGKSVSTYAHIEEARGGSHAYYHRMKQEEGPRAMEQVQGSLGFYLNRGGN